MGIHSPLISLHRIHNCSIMLYHYTTHLKLFPFFHPSFQNQPSKKQSNSNMKKFLGGLVTQKEQFGNNLIYTISILCVAGVPLLPLHHSLKVGALESRKRRLLHHHPPLPSTSAAGPQTGALCR